MPAPAVRQHGAGPVEEVARLLIELAVHARSEASGPSDILVDVTVGRTRCVVAGITAAARTMARPAGAVAGEPPAADRPEQACPVLSPREREIARMVARGYTNKEIARVLEISTCTVSAHLRRAFSKLDVSSRAAMVARLLTRGGEARPRTPARSGAEAGELRLLSSVQGGQSSAAREGRPA